jgi:uncharacterized membrane protein (DUF485 family)
VALDFGSQTPREQEDTATVARNSSAGVKLFFVYVLLYGGFMALSAFAPQKMDEIRIGGVNLAIIYGFGLILAALVLALIYMSICRAPASGSPEKKN